MGVGTGVGCVRFRFEVRKRHGKWRTRMPKGGGKEGIKKLGYYVTNRRRGEKN